jgi:glycosyltransferase involved in cell wall biosynthesis
MERPLFSVIVPTYNRPDFLAEALMSVRAQTVDSFECLVVDDAGSERVRLPGDPRFHVIRLTQNHGAPLSRNVGIEHAIGTYVTFLDDDDLYTPDRLRLALGGLHRAPVAVCWRAAMDGTPSGNRDLSGDVRDVILDGLTPHVGQVAVERTRILRFDLRFGASADLDWWLRVAHAERVRTVDQVGMRYRRHDGPRNRNGLRARIEASFLLLDRYSGYFATHPRAAAFRWKRVGLMARRLGEDRLARSAFQRSLRSRPQLSTSWHFIKAVGLSLGGSGNERYAS